MFYAQRDYKSAAYMHIQHLGTQSITWLIPLGAQIADLICRILLVIIHVYKLNIYPQDLQGSVQTNEGLKIYSKEFCVSH